MNKVVIENFCGSETEELNYMVEIAERLEKELGNDLSLDKAISLYGQLAYKSFIFRDGFIINDILSEEIYKTLGNRGASAVVSSLYNNNEINEEWFYWNYGTYLDTHKVESILPKLLASGNIRENKQINER